MPPLPECLPSPYAIRVILSSSFAVPFLCDRIMVSSATPARLTKIRVAECGTVRTITDVDEEDDRLKAAIDPNAPSETPVRLKLSEQGQTWSIFTSPWDSKDFEKAKLSWGQISSRPEDFGVGVRGEPEESLQIPDGDTFHTIKVSKKGAAYSFACTDGFFEGTLSSLDALIRVIDEKLTAEKPKAK